MSCPRNASSELAPALRSLIAWASYHPPNARPSRSALRSPIGNRAERRYWNDSIQLPLDVTVLLQENELQQALALEAENYSGIPALQSHFVCRKL